MADDKSTRGGLFDGFNQKQITLMVLLLGGGAGAGTIGSTVIAPYINDALEEHAEDPRAHATEFERLNAIEGRLGTIEGTMADQTKTIAKMNGNVDAVLQLLQKPK